MRLRCTSCGRYMSTADAYITGPRGYASHMNEKCLDKFTKQIKKITPKLNFHVEGSIFGESLRDLVNAWHSYGTIDTTQMPLDEIENGGIED